MDNDEKALYILEKAVDKAQKSLVKTNTLQPFCILLTDNKEVKIYENSIQNKEESYAKLEEITTKRLQVQDVDVLVLVCEAPIPKQIRQNHALSIRLHLEEKSQLGKKIGARFLYVPYKISLKDEEPASIELYQPIPVGILAVFIV